MSKRPFDGASEGEAKRVKVDDKEEKARRARERIAQLKAIKQVSQVKSIDESHFRAKEVNSDSQPERGKGLKVELHPLLTGGTWRSDNPNLQKVNKRGFVVNPYLTDNIPERKTRQFRFNERGKYISQGEELRKQQQELEEAKVLAEQKRQLGLQPDVGLQEEKYRVAEPPVCEWWDVPFFCDGGLVEEAISQYVQHPVPIMAPWEKHMPPPKPLFLTKKEMKRIRRQARAERYEELQDKIKLGLEPPPKPKVKLNNLMGALTNEAIRDPTAVEQRVRKEVEERRQQHVAKNESRKLTSEQKVEKLEQKVGRDLQKGFYSAVFLVDKLEHPSHKFKAERNASQLRLFGSILHCPKFVLIIVEGTEKNVRHYKRLMLNRIKWDEPTILDGEKIDLSGNRCELLWEGQLKDLHFKKWTVFRADSEQGALDYMAHFNVLNYYKEAIFRRS